MMSAYEHGGAAHPLESLDVASLGTEIKPIEVMVEADLFRIVMRLETLDNYSVSRTVVVKPQRGTDLELPRLLYIFENDTAVPKNSDSSSHMGAASLQVAKDGQTLAGTYWTARNWTKGLNTAGRVELRRPEPSEG